MELSLAGLHWSTYLIYVDGIICFSKTVEEHISRLYEIFGHICEAGFKLAHRKTSLFQHRLSFLGHKVSESGVCTDPAKDEVVKEWPIPRNVPNLRSFLGTAS